MLNGINRIEADIFFRMAKEHGTRGHKDKIMFLFEYSAGPFYGIMQKGCKQYYMKI